jgi:hypothetical protein
MVEPTLMTFFGFLIAGFGAGIGWAFGTWLVGRVLK